MNLLKKTTVISAFLIFLFSCSTTIIIEGKIEPVNVDHYSDLNIDIVLFDPESSDTVKVSSKLHNDGSFSARSSKDGYYIVHVDIPSSNYTISDSWLLHNPVQLIHRPVHLRMERQAIAKSQSKIVCSA